MGGRIVKGGEKAESAFLKPVSWKVFRLETLMRIWAVTLSTNSRNSSQL